MTAAICFLTTPRLMAGSATPFRLGDQGGVIVPVMLDGKGPFQMLLDTGATHSAITERVRAAVGAKVVRIIEWRDTPATGDIALHLAFERGRFLVTLPQSTARLSRDLVIYTILSEAGRPRNSP